MNEIEGFVLNGGMSSRMGTAKGALRIGGFTMAEHAANALLAVCDRVYAVGGKPIGGVETVADVAWKGENERASIIGLHSALLHCSSKFTAVLACDMPFVTRDVLKRLAAQISILGSDQADVIVPLDGNGRLQSLCAIYQRDRSRSAIDAYLETGELHVSGFLDRLRTHEISAANFADLENSQALFVNINTREDLAEAIRIRNKSSAS